jgi:hypothetical protein
LPPSPAHEREVELFFWSRSVKPDRRIKKTHAVKLGNDNRARSRQARAKMPARHFDGFESLVTKVLKSRRESQAAKIEMRQRVAINLILSARSEMPAAQAIPGSPKAHRV